MHMEKLIIFIAGIHGVGKTTYCNQLSEKTGFSHYSASELIKRIKKDSETVKDKRVRNIEGNQDILIDAIDKYIDKASVTLLDGHFCLLDSNLEVTAIPKATFEHIRLLAIITLHDTVESIAKKLTGRDGIVYDPALLSRFQDEEINYSRDIATSLGLPSLLCDVSHGVDEAVEFISKLTQGSVK